MIKITKKNKSRQIPESGQRFLINGKVQVVDRVEIRIKNGKMTVQVFFR